MTENYLYNDYRNGDKIYKKDKDKLMFKSTVNFNTLKVLINVIELHDYK